MKKLILSIAALAAMAVSGFAADVKLAWDANDPTELITKYVIYERVGANDTRLGVVEGATEVTLQNVAPGKHTYVVTAENMWGESAPSDPASTPGASTKPKNFRVIVVNVP